MVLIQTFLILGYKWECGPKWSAARPRDRVQSPIQALRGGLGPDGKRRKPKVLMDPSEEEEVL